MVAKKEKLTNIDYWYNLRLYFGFVKRYKFMFVSIMVFVLIVEATYLFDKFVFKIVIDRGTALLGGTLLANDFIKGLLFLGALYLIILVVRTIGRWLSMHYVAVIEGNLIFDVKRRFFNHILHLSHSFHTSHKTGSLISKLIRGGGAVENLTDIFVFNTAPLIFELFIVIGSILFFDFTSALVILISSVIFIAYSVIINKIQQNAVTAANDAEDFEKGNISDTFTNIESIKYFGKEDFIKRKFAKIGENTKNAIIRAWDYASWLESGQALIVGITTFFIVYFPLIKVLNHQMEIGTLVFIYTVYGNLMGPLWSFVWGVRNFYRSMTDFSALVKYNKIQNDIKDLSNAEELKIKKGKIEFKNVSFSYKKRKVLDSFNLKIPEGKKVALVGPSGAGKTTVVKLLYRLYDAETGEILIDDKNINSFKQESLRSELSIVPQECVLFDDSIYNNILFSRPEATKQDVFRAIRFAQLDKIISKFPKKENTIVGERGVKLSGGEKQRVSIARAILANKKVLVLDEATSALDSQTEHDIQKDLEELMKDRTSIIIAHRLSTVMKADFIVVIDNGKVVEVNTHEQLIKKPGLYRKLWDLQKGGYSK